MSVVGAIVGRARSFVARRQHPTVAVTDGPLTSAHARDVLASLDDRPLRQPDRTTCGSACLVLDRMVRDEGFSRTVLDSSAPEEAFARDARAVHRRTNRPWDARHHPQLPWPRALGTRPAAVVRLLEAPEGYGAAGRKYRRAFVDPADPAAVLAAVGGTVRAGEPVALFIGNELSPRHVVLVVDADDTGGLVVYDPSRGTQVPVARQAFVGAALNVAGWDTPWVAVLAR